MTKLYDHRGQPIDLSHLDDEDEKTITVRDVVRHSEASRLGPERLARLLRQADEGDTEAFFTLAEEMEEREGHYRSVLGTRKLAVAGLEVQVEAASDDAIDQEIADDVRDNLVKKPGFRGLLFNALDGIGKGVSLLRIHWRADAKQWRPERYQWMNPRHVAWDRETLSQPLLRTDEHPNGEELAAGRWIVHVPLLKSGLPLHGGLARVAAASFMIKSFSLRDWATFAEVFGFPLRLGKYPTNATKEDQAKLLRAVTRIGTDAAAIVPDSMLIEFPHIMNANGGEKLFAGLIQQAESTISKAVLGQTMTADNGSSLSQAKVHNDVRLDIKRFDALQLTETINRDLIAVYVALNYGPNARAPEVRLVADEPEDLKLLSEALTPFIDRGLEVEASVIRDKFGLPDPEPGAKVLGAKAQPQLTPPDGNASPPPPKKSAEDDEDAEEEDPKATNRRITTLERAVVVALNRIADRDVIDSLVSSELSGEWKPLLEPSVGTLLERIEAATSYEAVRALLDEAAATMDLTQFTDALAAAMTKARGLGDGTKAA